MKGKTMRTPLAITSAALLLALTACGGDGAEDSGADTEAQDESVPVTETDEAQEDAMPDDGPLFTEEMSYDQHSVYRDPDTGASLGTLSITSVDGSYECNGTSAIAVGVELNTVTESEPIELGEGGLAIMGEDGEVVDAVGVGGCDEPSTLSVGADDVASDVLVFAFEGESGAIAINQDDTQAYWSF